MTTTPYADVMHTDQTFLFNGWKYYFDEDHSYTYFVPNELAKTKYSHLVEASIINPFDEDDYRKDIKEDWGPDGFNSDEETYQMYLNEIPWRRQHHYFYFSPAWLDEEDAGDAPHHLDQDDIARWAGLDPADLIEEAPL